MTRPLIVLADYPRLRKKGHRHNSSQTRARSPCRRYIETDRIQGGKKRRRPPAARLDRAKSCMLFYSERNHLNLL